jgi:Family of unknown function (DUF5906)
MNKPFDRDDFMRSVLEEVKRVSPSANSASNSFDQSLKATANATVYEGQPVVPDKTPSEGVQFDDFVAYMPTHSYIFKPTGETWPASSVNARIPSITTDDGKSIKASLWLDTNRPVEQVTWAPGKPMEIDDRLFDAGGWIERPGCRVFNLYRPPGIAPRSGDAAPWLDHAHKVFGDDANHIVKWLAHRVQRPEDKINHALVLGGAEGIGKDTLLEPVKEAVGPWNFNEVSPQQMLGQFNGYVRSVILRINEARDLGDLDRFKFYDHIKVYTAAPPDVLRVNEKYLREYPAMNVLGVVITTNHKADGIYLPPGDRRHFVAWSPVTKDDFPDGYFGGLYRWFANGGNEYVADYLGRLDLSDFDAKAPPPKTDAFWDIVQASSAPEDAELADALDLLGRPEVTTLEHIKRVAPSEFALWLGDRKNARRIPHRLEACGYVPVRNPDVKDGLWKIDGTRRSVYARHELSLRDRLTGASRLMR